ncbi:MAG: respiratory chain complex I subunit 1 family protein [Solirubrobacteraceae bacterium]
MSGATAAAGAAQIIGGLCLAPLLPGLIQHWKARLQGRRGPSPLQPYRELGRLWGKSSVNVDGTSVVYRLAPAVAAASVAAAVLIVPAAELAPNWGVGHDALALAGFFALARFSLAASSWDVGNGFSLMGASRDLTISVFVEATLILSLTVAALATATTDLRGIIAGTAGTAVWSSPALALGAAAFALVVIAETGRQPVDNPDTHLELTMIHEGPLLEYAGRDLALLEWSAAARHWIVLVLGAELFLPHWGGFAARLACLAAGVALLCAALALTETAQSKMRVLRVPALLAGGCLLALVGLASWLIGGLS